MKTAHFFHFFLLGLTFFTTVDVNIARGNPPAPVYVASEVVTNDQDFMTKPQSEDPFGMFKIHVPGFQWGFFIPPPPFVGPVTPWNPYALVGSMPSLQPEWKQCNPYKQNACSPQLECIEEQLDGEILCPGRAKEMSVNAFGEVQCGVPALVGTRVTTKCTHGQVQQIPCIANTKWSLVNGDGPFGEIDAPHKWCHTTVACQGNDKSPKALCYDSCRVACDPDHDNNYCNNHCNNQCSSRIGLLEKCTYKIACYNSALKSRPNKNELGQTLVDTPACSDHHECASGYCQKINLTNSQSVNVCAPFAVCRKPCKIYGESVNSNNDEYCCLGLWKENGKCIDDRIIPSMPDDIEVDVNPASCEPNLYEIRGGSRVKVGDEVAGNSAKWEIKVLETGKQRIPVANGSDDKTIVARSFWQFERYMYAVEWLWAHANSPVLSHADGYKDMHAYAKTMGQHLKDARIGADNKYTKKLQELQAQRDAYMQATVGNGSGTVGSTGNSASGIEYLQLLAQDHMALAEIDATKLTYYTAALMEASGSGTGHGVLSTMLQNGGTPGQFYNKYGDKDNWYYFAGGFFPWFSTNMCGTRLQQNRVCVIEEWKASGLSVPQKKHLLDPLYPTGILSTTANQQNPNYAENTIGGALIGYAACGPVCAGVGAVIGALISFFKGWEIPVRSTDFNNNRSLLKTRIAEHFLPYANAILASPDASEQTYNTTNTVHNISSILHRDELKLALLQVDMPEAEFLLQLECLEAYTKTDPDKHADIIARCTAAQADWPLTPEKLRAYGLDRIVEMAIEHLVSYSGSNDEEYETTGYGYVEETLGVMINYLALYHTRSQTMHTEVAQCLMAISEHTKTKLTGGKSVAPGSAVTDNTGVDSMPADTSAMAAPTPCAGGACNPVQVENNITEFNLGLDGYNPGGFSDGGGSFGSGGYNGGGGFGTGTMSGGTLNDSLLAYRKKRLAERNRILAARKKRPGDDESGAQRLRNRLEHINGSKALVNMLKNGLVNNGAMTGISAPIDPNANKGSGSGSGSGADSKVSSKSGSTTGGEGNGGQGYGKTSLFGGDDYGAGGNGMGAGGTATGLSAYDEDTLLRDSQKGRGQKIDPEADTLFKQISRAYMHYGVPRLLKKKK